jgi:S1-C subfamily serine protease
MASLSDWQVPPALRPKPQDYAYDLDAALAAVVGLRATIPADAFTAETLGTERAGNGVLIRDDGLVLTIGYLITEADAIWLTLADGRILPATTLAYDQETGFGLAQALARQSFPALELGDSSAAQIGEQVVVGGAGGRDHSVAARIVGRREFAGYWEYVLDEAIFTAPAHPNWGGTAVIGPAGDLIAIGSLHLDSARAQGQTQHLNMNVPTDLLKPILPDLLKHGRRNRPARPWLGVFATEMDGHVVIAGLAGRGPAQRADLQTGDVIIAVAGHEVDDLAGFYRRVWSLGAAGVEVPLTIMRGGRSQDVHVTSTDRNSMLKTPSMH